MKTKFNTNWKASTQPKKQRKYVYNAPKHIKSTLMGAHLSEELRKRYGTRSIRVRKGDRVEIKRGQFKGKSGKIDRVDVKNCRVYIARIESTKIDGTKVYYPIHPSNLEVLELNLDDKRRADSLKRK